MAMEKETDRAKIKVIAGKKGLTVGRVKDTDDGIQFTKGVNPRLNEISWDEFFEILDKKGLAVYSSDGWLKIMKA